MTGRSNTNIYPPQAKSGATHMTDSTPAIAPALAAIDEHPPLVLSYTNAVTIESVANTIRHWGGLPVMSNDRREATDMLAGAQACLLNMGTLDERTEELMIQAGRQAGKGDVPVVFDPVGVGATGTRTRVAERIRETVDLDVIAGNHGEITALSGSAAEVRGVESVGEYADIVETAIGCARQTGAVVVAHGEIDVVATADGAVEIDVGDAMLGRFVGSGCMFGGTVATFVGALGSAKAPAAARAATAAFGLAGERAASDGSWEGPASYRTALLDMIAGMDPDRAGTELDERVTRIDAS